MDVGTGLAALGSAQVSKDVIVRMLGPTADYIGEGVRGWSERRIRNVRVVLGLAAEALGDELDMPGAVNVRALRNILQEAEVAEDELMQQYLAGLLAWSRRHDDSDDRGAGLALVIARLSAYELRLHYCVYDAARQALVRSRISGTLLWRAGDRDSYARMFIAEEELGPVFGHEDDLYIPSIRQAAGALLRERLLDLGVYGDVRDLSAVASPYLDLQSGLVFQLSRMGEALFAAAHGWRDDPAHCMVNEALPPLIAVPDIRAVPLFEVGTAMPISQDESE